MTAYPMAYSVMAESEDDEVVLPVVEVVDILDDARMVK